MGEKKLWFGSVDVSLGGLVWIFSIGLDQIWALDWCLKMAQKLQYWHWPILGPFDDSVVSYRAFGFPIRFGSG